MMLMFMGLTSCLMAQDGKVVGSLDSAECVYHRQLFKTMLDNDMCDWAAVHWRLCQRKCPAQWESIYTRGVFIYVKRIDDELEDKKLRDAYLDTVLWILDQRTEYFGNEAYSLALKGHYILKYRPAQVEKAQALFKKALKLQGKEVDPAVMIGMMRCLAEKRENASGPRQKQKLETEILNRHSDFVKTCESNRTKYKDSDPQKASRYAKCVETLHEITSPFIPD